jgi:(p)ppGpp synthase/HD superfamily hydrolase
MIEARSKEAASLGHCKTIEIAPAPPAAAYRLARSDLTEGNEMNELKILKATRVAADWHADQRRKGAKQEPYINHLIEVAELVAEADPGNINLAIAALLHDAIEDQKKTRAEIAVLFNERVADLVMEVTDDKSIDKAERKRLQVENAPKKSRDAKLLKLADKTSNLRSLAKSPPVDWAVERRREYVEWASRVAAGVMGISSWLDQRFEEAKVIALEATPAEAA